ncbi:hypothetical protein ACFE04_004630 [Oxalis oulophora]
MRNQTNQREGEESGLVGGLWIEGEGGLDEMGTNGTWSDMTNVTWSGIDSLTKDDSRRMGATKDSVWASDVRLTGLSGCLSFCNFIGLEEVDSGWASKAGLT